MIDCDHQWNWDKETRFCLKCGQVRTFPINGEAGKVLWQGFDDKRNPTELTSEEKNIIAHFANELGVKKAVGCLGISMGILRAWQGSYLRQPKPKLNKSIKSIKLSKEEQSVDLVKLSSQPATHDASHDTHQSVISPKSPLSTKVSRSDILPSFPPFNDNWEAPVQSEWLATYLELVKLIGNEV